MGLISKILVCDSLDDIPTDQTIRSLDRGIVLKIEFGNSIKSKKEIYGRKWQSEHPEFLVAIHTENPEIRIVKLISDEEIVEHQDFFEKCAKDYRNLATKLIYQFAKKYNLEIDENYPMHTLNASEKFGYKQFGKMADWDYAFHGFHCAFTHKETGQRIEVPLMCGLEFGELDPFFFVEFIKSSKEYEPLPIEFHNEYQDGKRILDKMVELGRFEEIQSNWPDRKAIVVADRERVEVKVCRPDQNIEKEISITGKYEKDSTTNKWYDQLNKLWMKLRNWW